MNRRTFLERSGAATGATLLGSVVPELNNAPEEQKKRPAQLLMVRETPRLAADLGSKIVRLFVAWPGVPIHNGTGTVGPGVYGRNTKCMIFYGIGSWLL